MYKINMDSLKFPLWNRWTNFHKISNGAVVLTIYANVLHHWTRWPPTISLRSYRAPRKFWGWILEYSIRGTKSTKFVQKMILGWSLIFLQHSQISVIIAVAILEECCMASVDMQWLILQVRELWPMGLLFYLLQGVSVFILFFSSLCKIWVHKRLRRLFLTHFC